MVPSTGPGGNASVQSNLPAANYQAVLPAAQFNKASGTNISGTITGTSVAGGSGVTFSINLMGLPDVVKYGPFSEFTTCSLGTNPTASIKGGSGG